MQCRCRTARWHRRCTWRTLFLVRAEASVVHSLQRMKWQTRPQLSHRERRQLRWHRHARETRTLQTQPRHSTTAALVTQQLVDVYSSGRESAAVADGQTVVLDVFFFAARWAAGRHRREDAVWTVQVRWRAPYAAAPTVHCHCIGTSHRRTAAALHGTVQLGFQLSRATQQQPRPRLLRWRRRRFHQCLRLHSAPCWYRLAAAVWRPCLSWSTDCHDSCIPGRPSRVQSAGNTHRSVCTASGSAASLRTHRTAFRRRGRSRLGRCCRSQDCARETRGHRWRLCRRWWTLQRQSIAVGRVSRSRAAGYAGTSAAKRRTYGMRPWSECLAVRTYNTTDVAGKRSLLCQQHFVTRGCWKSRTKTVHHNAAPDFRNCRMWH